MNQNIQLIPPSQIFRGGCGLRDAATMRLANSSVGMAEADWLNEIRCVIASANGLYRLSSDMWIPAARDFFAMFERTCPAETWTTEMLKGVHSM